MRSFPALLTTLLEHEDLSRDDITWAMNAIMSGEVDSAVIAGFLVALRSKGESVSEVVALVDVMRERGITLDVAGRPVDIVGTGGDQLNTVNISTMAAIVTAGAGQLVVKHGNRSASSQSGSADVLEELGVRLDLSPGHVAKVAEEVGITFCFAQTFHPSMKHAAGARRQLAIPTVFNILGPLSNPAGAKALAIGVGLPKRAELIAHVIAARGDAGLVMRGRDGLDELSVCDASDVWWIHQEKVVHHVIRPEEFGLTPAKIDDLRGGDPHVNATVVHHVLAGEKGPVRDAVQLNAAAGLLAAATERGEVSDFSEAFYRAFEKAGEAIDNGKSASVLQEWIEATA